MDAAAERRSTASGDHPLAAAILGNDALVAARPSTPAQLANACAAAGFDLVVPPTWGDELVAAAYLEQLAGRTEHVIVACACPRVATLTGRARAEAPLLSLAAPPVAVARALRAVHGDGLLITFIGDCPSASDPSIDVRFSPTGLFAQLERQGIVLSEQPKEFVAGDADRWRRYASMPGGLPALRFLARAPVDRVLRTLETAMLERGEIAPSRSNVLVDVADAAQCVCGGGRERIEEDEPPRSNTPVVQCPFGMSMAPEPSPRRRQAVSLRGPARAPSQVVASVTSPAGESPVRVRTPDPARETPASAATRRAAPQRRREVRRSALAVLPAIVIVLASALGVAVYAGGASTMRPITPNEAGPNSRSSGATGGGEERRSAVGPAAATERAAATTHATPGRSGDTARSPSTTGAGPAVPGPADRPLAGTDSAARRDSAARTAARRRARRAASVVPGWMPQGRPAFVPVDTSARKPDSSTAAPRDTTIPPA